MSDVTVIKLWETFHEPLKKFIAARVGNPHDVEDLVQEVFMKISQKLETLEDQEKLHAWIYQIARNVIVDYYRRLGSGAQVVLTPDLDEGAGRGPSAKVFGVSDGFEDADAADFGEAPNANAALAACLEGMIQRLPEKYREAILLTEFENLSQKALAQRLGMSVSGAKSRVQRARRLLKAMMLECCRLEFDRRGNIIDFEKHEEEKKC